MAMDSAVASIEIHSDEEQEEANHHQKPSYWKRAVGNLPTSVTAWLSIQANNTTAWWSRQSTNRRQLIVVSVVVLLVFLFNLGRAHSQLFKQRGAAVRTFVPQADASLRSERERVEQTIQQSEDDSSSGAASPNSQLQNEVAKVDDESASGDEWPETRRRTKPPKPAPPTTVEEEKQTGSSGIMNFFRRVFTGKTKAPTEPPRKRLKRVYRDEEPDNDSASDEDLRQKFYAPKTKRRGTNWVAEDSGSNSDSEGDVDERSALDTFKNENDWYSSQRRMRRNQRVPYQRRYYNDNLDANPTTEDDETYLKKKLRRLKAEHRVEELRSVVTELEQRRKLRQQMEDEYAWSDEQNEHRDLQRAMTREKWAVERLKHERFMAQQAGIDSTFRTAPSTALPDPGANSVFRNQLGLPELPSTVAGPCPGKDELAKRFLPYGEYRRDFLQQDGEYAYVTFVVNAEYVLGAAVLMHSIAISGSQYDRCVCVTSDISENDRALLSKLARVVEIERIPSPIYVENQRYKDTFTKLRVWQLILYRKVVYIDTDVVVLRNMDDLFDLPEWSVPMDAENDRYSTGLMVVQPSLQTFNDMLEKLKTTKVSMELPDLLFLKEYFETYYVKPNETPAPQKNYWESYNNNYNYKPTSPPKGPGETPVNIIPRWYQVYQEEFGSEYHSYLTRRKQKMTIFDDRIHGMHYPGNGKPWINIGQKLRKYSGSFCNWKHAMEFKYEAQFLWYLHFTLMKESVRKAATESVGFDWEAGAGVVVLSKYVAEIEEKIQQALKEQQQRQSWSYNSYNAQKENKYNSYTYNSYNSGTQAPIKAKETAVTVAPTDDTWWQPKRCVISVPKWTVIAEWPKEVLLPEFHLFDGPSRTKPKNAVLVSRTLPIPSILSNTSNATLDEETGHPQDPLVNTTHPHDNEGSHRYRRDHTLKAEVHDEKLKNEDATVNTTHPHDNKEGSHRYRRGHTLKPSGNFLHPGTNLDSASDDGSHPSQHGSDSANGNNTTNNETTLTDGKENTTRGSGRRLQAINTEVVTTTAAPAGALQKIWHYISGHRGKTSQQKRTRTITQDLNIPFQAKNDSTTVDDDSTNATEPPAGNPPISKENFPIIDLSMLPPVAFQLTQHWKGPSLEPYVWVVNWCSPNKIRPPETKPCGASAYVSQYSDGECRTNFAENLTLEVIRSRHSDRTITGVVLRSSVHLDNPSRTKWMEVVVRCDWTLTAETEVRLEHNVSTRVSARGGVPIIVPHPPHDRLYTIRLRSRCACAGGCGEAKIAMETLRREIEFERSKKNGLRNDDEKFIAWKRKVFGTSNPLAAIPKHSFWRKCFEVKNNQAGCAKLTQCVFSTNQQKCLPSTTDQWLNVKVEKEMMYCNCSKHVGGNAEFPRTLPQCQLEAAAAGANVVNFRPNPAPFHATAVPETSLVAPTSGPPQDDDDGAGERIQRPIRKRKGSEKFYDRRFRRRQKSMLQDNDEADTSEKFREKERRKRWRAYYDADANGSPVTGRRRLQQIDDSAAHQNGLHSSFESKRSSPQANPRLSKKDFSVAGSKVPKFACYYKLCPDDHVARGVVSLKKATKEDETGHDIYVRNPFYTTIPSIDSPGKVFAKITRTKTAGIANVQSPQKMQASRTISSPLYSVKNQSISLSKPPLKGGDLSTK